MLTSLMILIKPLVTTVIQWVVSLKLTAQQYTYAAIAIIFGVMVFALKRQGSKLHNLQVCYLMQHLDATQQLSDASIVASKKRLQQAQEAYDKAR
jgi:hypothetical protein